MKTFQEIKEILEKHKPFLREEYGVNEIGIFGSYIRSEQGTKSDIDILIDFEKPLGWEIVDLHEYLEDILQMKVDLVLKDAVLRKPLLWKSIEEDLVNV
jgi:predicted nucleotidyltransferase